MLTRTKCWNAILSLIPASETVRALVIASLLRRKMLSARPLSLEDTLARRIEALELHATNNGMLMSLSCTATGQSLDPISRRSSWQSRIIQSVKKAIAKDRKDGIGGVRFEMKEHVYVDSKITLSYV
jgi:hypothetical protein